MIPIRHDPPEGSIAAPIAHFSPPLPRGSLASSVPVTVLAAAMSWLWSMPASGDGTLWTFGNVGDRFAPDSGPGELAYYDPFDSGWGPVETQFGKASAFALPPLPGGDADVMAFPACTPEQGYRMLHEGLPNGPYGETSALVSNYTFIMDIHFPTTSDGVWRALWQTDVFNGSDGDFFVQDVPGGGIGIGGNYRGRVLPDTWHRIAIVVRAAPGEGQAQRFIDGRFVGAIGTTGSGLEERFALGPEVLLLADEGNETAPGYLASFHFVDRAMSMDEIAALGGPHAAGALTPGAAAPAYDVLLPRAVKAIGHRGGSFCCAPDNTIPAVRQAFLDGAAGVEVDTRLTADGVSVCFHDDTVDRTTDGTGFLDTFTLAELKQLDAGSWFDPAFAGERVPTLAEVMTEANGKGIVFLDQKVYGQADAIKAALDESGFPVEDLWIWVPGSSSEAAAIRAVIPDARLVWGAPDAQWITDPNYFSNLKAQGVVGFSFGFGGGAASPQFCARANEEGMFVEVYTILDPDVMIQAAAAGVGYIETDFPATVVALQPVREATASRPVPGDGEDVGTTTAVLSWLPGIDATAHRIHFGEVDPPPFVREQTDDLFLTPALEPGSTYFWRIDEVTPGGTVAGPLWTFTTPVPEPAGTIHEFGLDGNLQAALGTGVLGFSDFGTEAQVSFETTNGTTVPHIDGIPAGFLRIPAFFSSLDGLDLTLPDVPPNGGGAYLNRYAFVFDVYLPFDLNWMPFFNTDPTNSNDSDFFVRSDGAIGIGALGYSPVSSFQPDTWHRVVFSADLAAGTVSYFIDGNLVHRRVGGAITDERFALFANTEPGPHVRLFGDENGETHEVLVAAVAFLDAPLTDAQVALLGGAQAAGIFVEPTIPRLEIDRIGNFIALAWDAAPNRLLQRATSLEPDAWTDIEDTRGDDGYSETITPGATILFRLVELR